jgi:hypothetical protein
MHISHALQVEVGVSLGADQRHMIHRFQHRPILAHRSGNQRLVIRSDYNQRTAGLEHLHKSHYKALWIVNVLYDVRQHDEIEDLAIKAILGEIVADDG